MLTADPETILRSPGGGLDGKTFISDAALHLNELREGRSRLRAKDLVSLLLCHGARAWRSSQPRARVRIRVDSPLGGRALSLRVGSLAR
ncbi:hypothetical protein [Aureimonas frigidaquae]|uniref:Uncharacterized protein n=1 Tax=Aureimonas frigidaquae TaxID=424757 RepID=A0A0P0Z2R7_9HYPH|nr:hypothetical protein [Aureimonas frigidaquae]BAT28382.1 hypothetical protein [Aureimonas frigidaquae]